MLVLPQPGAGPLLSAISNFIAYLYGQTVSLLQPPAPSNQTCRSKERPLRPSWNVWIITAPICTDTACRTAQHGPSHQKQPFLPSSGFFSTTSVLKRGLCGQIVESHLSTLLLSLRHTAVPYPFLVTLKKWQTSPIWRILQFLTLSLLCLCPPPNSESVLIAVSMH